jgi:NTE family protein
MPDVQRKRLSVVLNATELRTGTAFRFGSLESGCWRFGKLTQAPRVATAVAASAAFPALLPSLDAQFTFIKDGMQTKHRTIITDGGVYDNLGASCMLPGRDSKFSTNAFSVDFVIACDAGQGIPSGVGRPIFWASRMLATILTIHRRTQTLTQSLLHRMAANQEISGFVMPYLGQQDSALPGPPPDLVRREDVVDYPTNFSPMKQENMDMLTTRGEQLTLCLLAAYAPDL